MYRTRKVLDYGWVVKCRPWKDLDYGWGVKCGRLMTLSVLGSHTEKMISPEKCARKFI